MLCFAIHPHSVEAKSRLETTIFGWRFTHTQTLDFPKNPASGIITRNYVLRLKQLYPDYQAIALQCERFARKRQFTDWARVVLVHKVSKRLYPGNTKNQAFAMALILRSIGINAQLFKNESEYELGLEADLPIYNGVMFEFKEQKFVLFDLQKGVLLRQPLKNPKGYFIDLNEELKQACRPMKLAPNSFPTFPSRDIKTHRKWTYQNNTYKLSYSINRYLIEYLKTYPQIHLTHYFNHPVSYRVYEQVLKPLRKIIEKNGFSEEEALEFLMAFHHHGFKHKDDLETKQGEHTNFVEETLTAKYSDCEDQSVLFAALVRGVLGYDVIGLEYPNHVSVAVKGSNVEPRGKIYKHKNKLYCEADPSYVGSKLGYVQPDLKKSSPKLIPVGKLRIVK